MSSHISSVRPSLVQRLLNRIGFLELPIKVNCWFCNQDSFILPGSKNTAEHWFCHLCENTNKVDNNGEIVDPAPLEVEKNTQSTPLTTRVASNDTTQTICEDCSKKQELIYDLMSKYLPDETDPEYESKYKNVDAENARLQNKYRLCNDCQSLVDMVVREKMEYLRVRDTNRRFASSITEVKVPKRPSRRRHTLQAIIYFITHIYTFSVVIYEILYPSVWAFTDISESFYSLIDYLKSEGFSYVTVENILYILKSPSLKFIIASILINFMSIITFDYHPSISQFQYERVKNWKSYQAFQIVLLIFRFTFTYMIVCSNSIWLIRGFIVYLSTLFMSFYTIKCVDGIKKEVYTSYVEEPTEEKEEEKEAAEEMDVDDDLSMMDISMVGDDPVDILTNKFNSL